MSENPRRPGRPTIGGRVTLALGPQLIERVDQARGKQTRAAWIRDAIERALPPTRAVTDQSQNGVG